MERRSVSSPSTVPTWAWPYPGGPSAWDADCLESNPGFLDDELDS
ncbi:hypothetical protein ACFJGV_02085 [Cnuibacter sp. UC19_7]